MEKSTDVLLLGTAASGKSTLLHYLHVVARGKTSNKFGRMKNSQKMSIFTQSTIGVEVEYLATGKIRRQPLRLREVGSPMIPMWNRYYSETNSIIYVTDISNKGLLAEATLEFWKMLDYLNSHKIIVPILFVCNKCNSIGGIKKNELEKIFRLNVIQKQSSNISVIETDFVDTEENAMKSGEKVIKWILETFPNT